MIVVTNLVIAVRNLVIVVTKIVIVVTKLVIVVTKFILHNTRSLYFGKFAKSTGLFRITIVTLFRNYKFTNYLTYRLTIRYIFYT